MKDPGKAVKPVEAPARVSPGEVDSADDRTALSTKVLKRAFLDNLFYMQGKFPALATRNDYYMALAYVVRGKKSIKRGFAQCTDFYFLLF